MFLWWSTAVPTFGEKVLDFVYPFVNSGVHGSYVDSLSISFSLDLYFWWSLSVSIPLFSLSIGRQLVQRYDPPVTLERKFT